jgi:RNase P/RNase MRP subunit p29
VQYASQRGLKSGTLLWWSKRVETASDDRPQAQGAAGRVSFVPLRVRQQSPDASTAVHATASIEVILSNGRRVRVTGEVDKADLARVLDAAEGGPGC